MKKIFYAMVFCGALLAACQENEMNTFDSEGAVYFQLASNWADAVDSVVYSFISPPSNQRSWSYFSSFQTRSIQV